MRAQSQSLDKLASALVAAQAEFTAIPKDSANPFFKSRYSSLAQVKATASPVLAKHGLAVAQFIGTDEQGHDELTTWLLHTSGQFLAESMRLYLAKEDPQGQGSATTYARRYSYMAALGLVADEDDDAETVRQRQQSPPRVATLPPKPVESLATTADIDALREAARGKTMKQIKLALTSVGVTPEGDDVLAAFRKVPRDKTVVLAKKLAEAA